MPIIGLVRPNVDRLVVAGAMQSKGFETSQLTIRPHHIIIDDLDRGGAAANRAWIESKTCDIRSNDAATHSRHRRSVRCCSCGPRA